MDKNTVAVNLFNKLANEYQQKYMDVSLYGASLDFFCGNIRKENPSILEVACGPGNITRYLLSQRPDFCILGTDLAPNMIALARINNPSAEFRVLDCRLIGKLTQKYDGIVCGFGFPYLSMQEAIQWIKDASCLLNEGGLLYISTMEDDYSRSGYQKGSSGDEIFMHYHQGEYLTAALEENHCSVVYTDRVITNYPDGTMVTDLVLISRKRVEEPNLKVPIEEA